MNMALPLRPPQQVGIAGLGTLGKALARALDSGGLPGLALGAVTARDAALARHWMGAHLSHAVDCVDLDTLAERCDWVVECAPACLLRAIAEPALRRGRRLVVMSSGALLDAPDLIDMARESGGQILIPTGGLLGLDAVTAACEGSIQSVTLVTRKPIAGLLGAPLLVRRQGEPAGDDAPEVVGAARREERAVAAVVEQDEHAHHHAAGQDGERDGEPPRDGEREPHRHPGADVAADRRDELPRGAPRVGLAERCRGLVRKTSQTKDFLVI